MPIYKLDPLDDPRWPEFLSRHPSSSVFHTSGWLLALQRTYSYQPIVYTTTPGRQELADGLVFCRVKSWLSGSRLVSLPFSDHCEPLTDNSEISADVIDRLKELQRREGWRYIELRPRTASDSSLNISGLAPSESYLLQTLDLRCDIDTLFHGFHKSCVQRKIQRAEREQLTYENGRSESLLSKFYFLLILTRRRHGLPPQPLAWFRNLLASIGENASIRVASKGDCPVASILTIFHKDALVYKYGCSDTRFNNLGGTQLLFWKAIQEAKSAGAHSFDLGRSELNNPGLITFKENWGASSRELNYYRLPAECASRKPWNGHSRVVKSIFSKMPENLLTATGKLLYRHIG
jgi:hypothetical protein